MKHLIFSLKYTFFYFFILLFILGYPLVWGDTAFYVNNAFENVLSPNGSVLYPKFINIFSFHSSYWLICIAQSIYALSFISFFLEKHKLLKHGTQKNISISILLFSSLSIFCFTITTDIFLPITILSLYSVIIFDRTSKVDYFIFISFLVTSCLMHRGFWHVTLLVLIVVSILISLSRKYRIAYKINLLIAFSVLFSMKIILEPIIELTYTKNHEVFKEMNIYCRQIQLLSRSDVFDTITSKCCKENSELACRLNDDYHHKKKVNLNFKTNENKSECKKILISAIKKPPIVLELLKTNIENNITQYKNIFVLGGMYRKHVGDKMDLYIKSDFNIQNSKLRNNNLNLKSFKILNKFLIICSLILILLHLIFNRRSHITPLIIFILLSIILCTWFYASFSNHTNPRYMSRLSWMVTFSGLLCIEPLKKIYRNIKQ